MKSCKNCALNSANGCIIFKEIVNPDDYCPKFTTELFTCSCCNVQIHPKAVIINQDDGRIYCVNCAQRLL